MRDGLILENVEEIFLLKLELTFLTLLKAAIALLIEKKLLETSVSSSFTLRLIDADEFMNLYIADILQAME